MKTRSPEKKLKRGLRPSTFVKAAELLASEGNNGFACHSLREAVHDSDWRSFGVSEGEQFFADTLRPGAGSSAWYYDCTDGLTDDERTNARIFGLLLCAELLKDEQRRKRSAR